VCKDTKKVESSKFVIQSFSGAGNLLSVAIPRALLSQRLLRDFHCNQG